MPIWDEGLSGRLIAASALVGGAFLLQRLAPLMGPGARSFAMSGLQLFAEAEFEMQDGIIGKLAEQVVEELLQAVPARGADQHSHQAAREIVGRFERTARERSSRHGWHERDKRARYRHHVRKLRHAMAQASRHVSPEKQRYLSQASAALSEDW
jgi:hypothetical protein